MMYQFGLHKRRGVGSIIAGAFIVLIILLGYEFYLLNNQVQNDYQEVVTTMQHTDILQSQEELELMFYSAVDDVDHTIDIEIGVINNGPEIVEIKYAALHLDGDIIKDDSIIPQAYLPANTINGIALVRADLTNEGIAILPSQRITIFLQFSNSLVLFDAEEKYSIHLVSERGNILPMRKSDIISNVGDTTKEEIADVIGAVIPKYDSFRWATRDTLQLDELDWHDSWAVPYNQQLYHMFKIDITFYGNEPLTLGDNTGLYMHNLDGSQSIQFYLSDYNPDTNTIAEYGYVDISNENWITLLPRASKIVPYNKYTLCFVTSEESGNPVESNALSKFQNPQAAARYQVVLGIYEKDAGYSQAFSLIAIEVVN